MTAPDLGPTPDPQGPQEPPTLAECEARALAHLDVVARCIIDKLLGCEAVYKTVQRGILVGQELYNAAGDLETAEHLREFGEFTGKALWLVRCVARIRAGQV